MGSDASSSSQNHHPDSSDDTNTVYSIQSEISMLSNGLNQPVMGPKTTSSNTSSNVPKQTRRGNGIAGEFISNIVCNLAAKFWINNIASLILEEQLEIGCSIFYSMISSDKDLKEVMRAKNIEETSLKYLDMMGWLVRSMKNRDIDLYQLLRKLGDMHKAMGIETPHFNQMLLSMHETFSYYFPTQYTPEVKYALTEIFSLSVDIMTSTDLKYPKQLHTTLDNNDISFLESLDICLQSKIGYNCFDKYLKQAFCDEIAIFLELIMKFRNQNTSDKQRLVIARDIMKTCIDPNAIFAVDISHKTRDTVLYDMDLLEEKCMVLEEHPVSTELFSQVEQDVRSLIMENHWNLFVQNVKGSQH